MEKDKKEKKGKRAWIDVVLLAVLTVLVFWTYQQSSLNYRNMAASHATLQSLVALQTDRVREYKQLSREYKQEITLVRERLDKAELSLNEVYNDLNRTQGDLSKVQTENDALRQRIALVDAVADLEGAVARLKEKNALLINHISSIKRETFPKAQNIKTLKQGRTVIAQYHDRLRKVKGRLRELKRTEHLRRIAIQKERDRIMMLAGNNGYLMRNGEYSPVVIVLPVSDENAEKISPATEVGSRGSPANKDVKIEVTFVK